MKEIIQKSISKGISYTSYRKLVADLLAEGKSTGPNQSEALYNYSLLNDRRMKRLDKTTKLSEETVQSLKEIDESQTWLVLTEGWCGDAAQNIPVLHKMAEENPNIDLQLVLRDEHTELMDLFLTNGSQSIPKLISLDKEQNIQFTWGPRPSIPTKMIADYKAEHGVVDVKVKEEIQVWYNKNKSENLQKDIVSLLQKETVQ